MRRDCLLEIGIEVRITIRLELFVPHNVNVRSFGSFHFELSYLVIGEPYDDPKGHRRIGSGLNGPVNDTLKANKSQAN